MMAKTARGTRYLHQLFPAVPEFPVTRQHIVRYLAGDVDGHTDRQDVEALWNERRKPILQARRSATSVWTGAATIRFATACSCTAAASWVLRCTSRRLRITPLEDLALPSQLLSTLCESTSGFIAITGPTGSGKTATALSILDWHNTRHPGHIVTIEGWRTGSRPRNAG